MFYLYSHVVSRVDNVVWLALICYLVLFEYVFQLRFFHLCTSKVDGMKTFGLCAIRCWSRMKWWECVKNLKGWYQSIRTQSVVHRIHVVSNTFLVMGSYYWWSLICVGQSDCIFRLGQLNYELLFICNVLQYPVFSEFVFCQTSLQVNYDYLYECGVHWCPTDPKIIH